MGASPCQCATQHKSKPLEHEDSDQGDHAQVASTLGRVTLKSDVMVLRSRLKGGPHVRESETCAASCSLTRRSPQEQWPRCSEVGTTADLAYLGLLERLSQSSKRVGAMRGWSPGVRD